MPETADLTPDQWRRIFLDIEAGDAELEGIHTEERFFPLRSGRGLTSGEHFARYLFAAGYCRGKRVLDVACGSGYGAYILKLLGAAEVVGVDRDARTIEFARRRYQAAGLQFRAGDASRCQVPGSVFDVIVSFETIEHVEDPDDFLASVKRRLAPGGLFIVSCPHDAKSPWVSPFHLRHYTYQEFRDLVARHFPDPAPVSQIHGIASLILPVEAAVADGLARQPLAETYLDVSKGVEDSDIFLLLCGGGAIPRPVVVITKNLSEVLTEIYAGANYIRDRVPRLEFELGEAHLRIERQWDQLRKLDRALEDQKAYTLDLQYELESVRHSRTWQLMLAVREALGSPRRLVALPLRILRILIEPPVVAVPEQAAAAPVSRLLPRFLPHRRSTIRDWPADRPLVTVDIPCYNYGRFVGEAIDSVLASTLQDFEIVVVDDGSTEAETVAVLGELEGNARGSRVRVVHQPNQGLAAARNKGAALARGKYVVSLDADDRIAPTYLEKAAWALEHHPEYAFCYSLAQFFGAEQELWKTEPFDLEKALQYNHVTTAAMFRREAWVEAGGFRDDLHGQDDWNFWITCGALGWKGCLITEPLFYYRKHQTSMWAQIRMEERERTAEKIRALHSYLIGEGDPRAAEQFGRPQDPVVRAALDRPEPPPHDRCPLPQRSHLCFGQDRPALLFVIPWMSIGGAEQVILQVMRGLAADYGLAVATTLDARHDWEGEFRRLTPGIYHLSRLPIDDPGRYLSDLCAAHHLSGVIISGSALAYQALPALKKKSDLWIADIVHNIVPEGYLETSIRADRHLDCHFAVGGPQQQALINAGVAAEKTRLAPTSADATGRLDPAAYTARLPEIRHKLALTGGEIVLTYIARLAAEKDVPLFVRVVGHLVRAWPQRRFRAFIVGDGPERARVEHEIRVQGLQSIVEILGFTDQVADVLAASRFAFLTSRFEGSSVTLLEAMSMRQVVFAADVGNVRQVIEDGVNGFVVSTREPADFAARVAEALADPAAEAAIRDRARQTILDRFDVAAMVRVYSETIGRALAQRRQPA